VTTPAAVVTLRVLDALGLGADRERARAVLVQAAARQLPRLSVQDIRDVLAAVGPAVPAQRGEQVYVRDEQPDPGAAARYTGPRHGGVTEEGLVEE
jgi:hypothetical protein